MSTTVRIDDKNEMVGFLRTLGTDSMFVSLRTETVVDQRKFINTGKLIPSKAKRKSKKMIQERMPNPYYGAIKICRRNGLINVNFVKSVRRKLAEINGIPFSETEYDPGDVWYRHLKSEDNRRLPLCVHKENKRRFYLQYFPLRNIGKATYWIGDKQMTDEEVADMYKRFVVEDDKEEFKPEVRAIAIDSIREIKARQITILNDTISRIANRLKGKSNIPAQPPIPKA